VITLKRALDNVKPTLEVKSPPGRRRHLPGADRGAGDPRDDAGAALAHHLLPRTSREDDDRAPHERDPRREQRPGRAVKRREDMHKMAESNKAFAHYRW
jgi:small subunit ribosomal protein S7